MKATSERKDRYERTVSKVLVHPDFKKERPYDIAILEMDRFVVPTNIGIVRVTVSVATIVVVSAGVEI